MKKAIWIAIITISIASCKDEPKKNSSYQTTVKTAQKPTKSSNEIPIDMSNKGIGPIKNISLEKINQELVAKGKQEFDKVCTACHMIDKNLIGPALRGITKRRSAEWLLNIMLNTSEMLKKDSIAKKLLEEYKAPMINQNLTQEQAREILEYLRTI